MLRDMGPGSIPRCDIVYRIFKVSPDGLLKRPKDLDYGLERNQFEDFSSLEAAREALLKDEVLSGDYVAMPVLVRHEEWP